MRACQVIFMQVIHVEFRNSFETLKVTGGGGKSGGGVLVLIADLLLSTFKSTTKNIGIKKAANAALLSIIVDAGTQTSLTMLATRLN